MHFPFVGAERFIGSCDELSVICEGRAALSCFVGPQLVPDCKENPRTYKTGRARPDCNLLMRCSL